MGLIASKGGGWIWHIRVTPDTGFQPLAAGTTVAFLSPHTGGLHMRTFIPSATIALLLAGCGAPSGSSDNPQDTPPADTNNSGMVSGPSVGSGQFDVSELRRNLSVTPVGSGDFQLGEAWLSRSNDTADAQQLMVEMTYQGSQTECFIKASTLTLRDSDGVELTSWGASNYIQGSVGFLGGDSYTDTCLQPGETGWVNTLVGISSNTAVPFQDPVSVEIEMELFSVGGVSAPGAITRPASYTMEGSGISFDIENTGTGDAYLEEGYHTYMLLDPAGKPLWWSFANDQMTTGSLSPNATGFVATDGYYYDGSAERVRVFVDFSGAPEVNSVNPSDSLLEHRLLARDQHIQELAATLDRQP
jgi:hypothetical protein